MSRRHDQHMAGLWVAQQARRERFTTVISGESTPPASAVTNAADTAFPADRAAAPSNLDFRVPIKQPLLAFASLCRAAGLPEPVAEFRFHATRLWRFDWAWPAHKLALEVEGGIWTQGRHTRGAGAAADLQKYSEAAILGWRLLYVEPRYLHTTGIEYVRRALITREAA